MLTKLDFSKLGGMGGGGEGAEGMEGLDDGGDDDVSTSPFNLFTY